jgi:aerobic-type carbon monoxide dehydrogenase small subunit (CoxS/CutS family)
MSDESVQPHIERSTPLRVNGALVAVHVEPGARLLDLLRGPLGLTGTKEACGRGECGACTVLIDDLPVVSCLVYAETVSGEVTTIEGLPDANEDLRQAFADCGAFQCGFCTPGQVVRAAALLNEPWPADVAEQARFVRHGMSGNLCRCTGYAGIVEAVMLTKARRAGLDSSSPAGEAPVTPGL